MASKNQYDFFHALYEEEERTYQQLEGRARVYLGVISAFLAAVLLKTSDVIESANALNIPWWMILVEAILLAVALVVILYALRIRAYEAVNDGKAIIEEFGEYIPTDEEFFDDRIADYAVASSRNREENNHTAYFLSWASRLLVSSMIFLMIIFIIALRNSP